MRPLKFIRKFLQDHLSLSTKLFIKELITTTTRKLSAPFTFHHKKESDDENFERPCIVIFDERVPSPDRDAGSARMFMILKTLVQRNQVIFVPFYRPQGIEYEEALWKEGIATAKAVDYRSLLRKANLQAVIVSRPNIAEVMIHRIRRTNRRIRIIFDMVDVHFLRLEREYKVRRDERIARAAKRYRALELKLIRESDITWCASAEEQSLLRQEDAQSAIVVIPTIHPLRPTGKTFDERQDLLFIGNFAHRPNEDAVQFFIKDIFPLVQRFLPGVTTLIVGDNPTKDISSYASPQIKIMGYMPALEPVLESCRIMVAPLRFGAGVKGKIGEAMAAGLPVVTTTIGAEGFGLTHLTDVLIADDGPAFAAAVVKLYSTKELWQTLSKNSRRHIEQYFTPEVIATSINNTVGSDP
jgi:glycosyltransferase involved in cell wall biosynthesis